MVPLRVVRGTDMHDAKSSARIRRTRSSSPFAAATITSSVTSVSSVLLPLRITCLTPQGAVCNFRGTDDDARLIADR
jgi:hypothetical protein